MLKKFEVGKYYRYVGDGGKLTVPEIEVVNNGEPWMCVSEQSIIGGATSWVGFKGVNGGQWCYDLSEFIEVTSDNIPIGDVQDNQVVAAVVQEINKITGQEVAAATINEENPNITPDGWRSLKDFPAPEDGSYFAMFGKSEKDQTPILFHWDSEEAKFVCSNGYSWDIKEEFDPWWLPITRRAEPEPKYVLLANGMLIKEGDEQYFCNDEEPDWCPVTGAIGDIYANRHLPMRRKIEK